MPVAVSWLPPAASMRPGDAEVGDQRLSAREQDVVGLDVAMDDAALVGVGQRGGHLRRDLKAVRDRQLPFPLQAVPKRFPLHVRHHVVEEAVGRAGIEERKNVRMLQAGGDGDLAKEPLGARATAASSGCSTLSATLRRCLRSSARYTVAMPPWPELALDAVAVGEGGYQTGRRAGHFFTFSFNSSNQFSTRTNWTPGFGTVVTWRDIRNRLSSGEMSNGVYHSCAVR